MPPFIAILFGVLSCSSPGAIRRGLGLCKHETDEYEGRGDPMLESCTDIHEEIYHDMELAHKEWEKKHDADDWRCCGACWIRCLCRGFSFLMLG